MEKICLPNGLRLLLEHDERAKTAALGVWTGAGTRFENPEFSGVSHFIEHMLFKGTKSRSAFDIAETMDSIGANFNAFTSKEYTCYYLRTPGKHIETAADVLFDMLTNPKFASADIDTERGVILEEISMYEDSPEDLMSDSLYSSVWCDSTLGDNILGTRKTVGLMDGDTLRAYMRRMYSPERSVISVSGNFDREMLLGKVSEYFSAAVNTNNPISAEPSRFHSSIIIRKKEFEQINLCIAFPGIKISDDRKYALSILNAVAGGASSSRLFQRIREELGFAYSIGSSHTGHLEEGFWSVDMGVSRGQEREALTETCAVLNSLRDGGITEHELQRVRQQLVAGVFMNSESWMARASYRGRSELLENGVTGYDEVAERIESVSLDEVNTLASELIDFSKAAMAIVGNVENGKDFYDSIIHK